MIIKQANIIQSKNNYYIEIFFIDNSNCILKLQNNEQKDGILINNGYYSLDIKSRTIDVADLIINKRFLLQYSQLGLIDATITQAIRDHQLKDKNNNILRLETLFSKLQNDNKEVRKKTFINDKNVYLFSYNPKGYTINLDPNEQYKEIYLITNMLGDKFIAIENLRGITHCYLIVKSSNTSKNESLIIGNARYLVVGKVDFNTVNIYAKEKSEEVKLFFNRVLKSLLQETEKKSQKSKNGAVPKKKIKSKNNITKRGQDSIKEERSRLTGNENNTDNMLSKKLQIKVLEEELKDLTASTYRNTLNWRIDMNGEEIRFVSESGDTIITRNGEKGTLVYYKWYGKRYKDLKISRTNLNFPRRYLSDPIIVLLYQITNKKSGQSNNNSDTSFNKQDNKTDISNNIKANASPEIINEMFVGKKDFVVYSSNLTCRYKHHKLENIRAVIDILPYNHDQMITIKKQGAYCRNCNVFYILKEDIESVTEIGTPQYKIISKDYYIRNGKVFFDYHEGDSSYILSNYGYNVQANNGLSQLQRHKILKNIIDLDVLTISEIKQKIRGFQAQKRNMSNYARAVKKWEDDYQFLDRLSKGKDVAVSLIKTKNYKQL